MELRLVHSAFLNHMPISLNRIFNAPTREEKFTEKRDKELGEQRKEFYSYLDKLEREKEDYAFNRDKARARSALEVGMGVAPDEAGRMVEGAASKGLLANLEQARQIEGALPSAGVRGMKRATLDQQTTENELAKLENEQAIRAAEKPYREDVARKGQLFKIGNLDVGLKRAENEGRKADWEAATFDQIAPLEYDANVAELQARPVLASQRTKLGEQAVEAGGLANRLGGVNTRAAERGEGVLKSLLPRYPDMLETELLKPYEEGLTDIARSKGMRSYLETASPEDIKRLLRIARPEESMDWRGNAGVVGAPGNVAKPSLADVLKQIELTP